MSFSSPFHDAAQSPPLVQLPPDSFFRLFVKLNQLDQIAHFLFLPGMLFHDTLQWWGSRPRLHPHEGMDIYLMQDREARAITVLPQMLIPAMLSGELVHFHRDFLGETIYIRHPEMRQKNAVLHTLYGHISPAGSVLGVQTSTGLTCPSFINKGQIVGTISPPPETSSVPAHLHISCAWIDADQQLQELSWEKMSVGSNIVFIDPLPFLLQ